MPSKEDQPSREAFQGAAWLLMCDVAAVHAVAVVEAGPEGAFLDTGEPTILYEPHVFSRLTGGRHDGRRAPGSGDSKWGELSYPKWRTGWYGPTDVQHRRLAAAAALNRTAALKACSWGAFQLLGENHAACGYPDLQRFVNAMYRSADDHLRAFVQFIRHDKRLVDAIRERDWEAFARRYNGPGFKKNRYDTRMAAAYAAWKTAA